LTADLFLGATNEDIREMFRRMNSYTVPLNAEEKRHAEFQGEFKWFIYRLTKKYAQALEDMGAVSEKSLARMQDARLMSEFCHAVLNGIQLTKAQELRRLYDDKDKKFPEEKQLEKRLSTAIDEVIDWTDIHGTQLMKPYQLYALLLAITHSRQTVSTLADDYEFVNKKVGQGTIIQNLTQLASVLDEPEAAPKKFQPFIEASESKTNVQHYRRVRFQFYCRALDDEL